MNRADFTSLASSRRDPWAFLSQLVRTQDPARGIASFPDYPYLRDFVSLIDRERFVLVPKSRQMLVTWTMVAFTLWRALFRGPGLHLFLSRNERCADELLERVRFIIDQLPPSLRPRLTTNCREEIAFGKLGSRILSLPASPNGPRMYSPSSVFWDEMAFTPFDEQIWTALKPALDSGGSFVGVSSSGGANNLFAKLVLSSLPPLPSPRPARPPFAPPQAGGNCEFPPVHGGTEGGSNLASLFHLHRIHYSAHPDRTTESWRQQAAAGLSLTRWQQEQEISFDSFSNVVYDEFDVQTHILNSDWPVRPEWELFRSIDFGYHHPFVLWFQRTPEGDLIIFDEWAGRDATTEQMSGCIRNIDYAHGICEGHMQWTACDPAGAQVQDTGISPVDSLRRAGMKLKHRPSRIAAGVELVKRALRDASGRVTLRISPRCRHLIADFGRYQWSAAKDEPEKDGLCDHSMDALRYFFVNFDSAAEDLPFSPRMAGCRW